jgi:hypothetical protein
MWAPVTGWGKVEGVDTVQEVEVEVEQGVRGSLITVTIWLASRHPGCSVPYFDHACVRVQNQGYR